MKTTIRKAKNSELEKLSELENAIFEKDAFNERQTRYLLASANSTYLVVEQDDDLAGSAVLLWKRNSRRGRIYSIGIRPDYAGRGLGKRLLDACEKEAEKRGCNSVSLEVRESNDRAIALYERNGYEKKEKLPAYYPDGEQAVKMKKQLNL